MSACRIARVTRVKRSVPRPRSDPQMGSVPKKARDPVNESEPHMVRDPIKRSASR
jgi:hypothetical protein